MFPLLCLIGLLLVALLLLLRLRMRETASTDDFALVDLRGDRRLKNVPIRAAAKWPIALRQAAVPDGPSDDPERKDHFCKLLGRVLAPDFLDPENVRSRVLFLPQRNLVFLDLTGTTDPPSLIRWERITTNRTRNYLHTSEYILIAFRMTPGTRETAPVTLESMVELLDNVLTPNARRDESRSGGPVFPDGIHRSHSEQETAKGLFLYWSTLELGEFRPGAYAWSDGKILLLAFALENTYTRTPISAKAKAEEAARLSTFTLTTLPEKITFRVGEPVPHTLRLTNKMSRDASVRDRPWHHPIYAFDVTGSDGNTLPLSKEFSPFFSDLPEGYEEYKTMPPGTTCDVTVDLADWYDLSQPDRYTVTAHWCGFVKSEPYERTADPITIEVLRRE